jgi:hypothetical protein
MLKQILVYNFEVVKINSLVININALLLIGVLLLVTILNWKFKSFILRIIQRIIYLVILISFLRIFIFQGASTKIFDFNFNSPLSYYIYNIINNPINSLNSFFMVYSHLSILIFILFYPILKSHLKFISFITLSQILIIIFNFLKLGYQVFSLYQIILYLIGYLIGYVIYKLYYLIMHH